VSDSKLYGVSNPVRSHSSRTTGQGQGSEAAADRGWILSFRFVELLHVRIDCGLPASNDAIAAVETVMSYTLIEWILPSQRAVVNIDDRG
jgi:hypothetical protein